MLNMKKGLAIVLAAATALTFAPVSTLGLTGVVEAQAAAATSLSDSSEKEPWSITPSAAKTTSTPWKLGTNSAKKSYGKGNATLSSSDNIFFIEINGLKSTTATAAANSTVTIGAPSTNAVERVDPDALQNSATGKVVVNGVANSGTEDKKVVAFAAKNKGVATVTLTSDNGTPSDNTDDETLTLTLTVNGPVASNSSVSFTNTATTPETISTFDLKSSDTAPSAPNAKIKVSC